MLERILHPGRRIALVGKYVHCKDAYKKVTEALAHGGLAVRSDINPHEAEDLKSPRIVLQRWMAFWFRGLAVAGFW